MSFTVRTRCLLTAPRTSISEAPRTSQGTREVPPDRVGTQTWQTHRDAAKVCVGDAQRGAEHVLLYLTVNRRGAEHRAREGLTYVWCAACDRSCVLRLLWYREPNKRTAMKLSDRFAWALYAIRLRFASFKCVSVTKACRISVGGDLKYASSAIFYGEIWWTFLQTHIYECLYSMRVCLHIYLYSTQIFAYIASTRISV